MADFSPVLNYVGRYIALDTEEQAFFCSLLRATTLRKRQCVVQPEFVCKYRSYVVKGAMRAYLAAPDGHEHTVAFAIEDWWISDYNSYVHQVPATLFVEALEPTELIQLDYNAEQLLMEQVPKFERFFRIITQRSFAHLQQRLITNLSLTAEERYDAFMSKYPGIAARVPQYTLASYLGISAEFISKIRRKQAGKKG